MSAEDAPAVRELLALSMGGGPTGERSPEFFAWKHHANVFGPSPGVVAVHNGRLVGVRLFLRWSLRWRGRDLRAVRAVDTATHPDFGRQGIFTRLTLELLDDLDASGEVDLVFNTPNASSLGGYLKMGWQPVGDLPIHVGTVHPLRFLRGMGAARRASAGSSAADYTAVTASAARPTKLPTAVEVLAREPGLEELLSSAPDNEGVHTPISSDYLRWRYTAPGLDYRGVPVHRGGRLIALGLGRVRTRAGLTELTLGDVLAGPGHVGGAAAVLAAARRSGVDHVTLHAGSPLMRAAVRRAGYLPALGSGVKLVANPRRGLDPDVLDLHQWQLSLGDLEVF
jgi:hypothetical protein